MKISSATFTDHLSLVEEDMVLVDDWMQQQLESTTPEISPLLVHARRFRGKRLRAAQVLLIARALGRVTQQHRVLAGVIEMIHTATLVHDDLLDEAGIRRGVDCVHVEWGSHACVLLGDWIWSRAFQGIAELRHPEASLLLAEATARVCAGEIHQNLTRRNFQLSESDYIQQIDGKTGALYEAGARIAALFSSAPQGVVESVGHHALLAGRAFQIIDDILDLEGDEQKVGKSLGTDLARGKMTLPLIRLRDQLEGDQVRQLSEQFGRAELADSLEMGPLAGPFREALEVARMDAFAMLDRAADSLHCLPKGEAQLALISLTRHLGTRIR
ncbi:MAG: polyprenyl synthetase family protein [Planctomycetes bacterium]|nr:polyprenyl synthetase family protein [Planctomycetota bacterium]